MEVTVAMPEVDSLTLRKTYPGYTEATQEADVVARVNGHITRKYFDDGQYVAAGAPLFEIESTTYRDQVARAEAQLQTAIATRDYATREYQAMKKALESDAVSKMSVIQAESAANEAEAAVKNAHAALQTARTTLGYCTIRQAAQMGGEVRFRPIMMTALAFVFGVMPMLFASGAGAESRISLGCAVVFGMAVNAFVGTLFVPNFWELFQRFQEKYLSKLFAGSTATPASAQNPGTSEAQPSANPADNQTNTPKVDK